jgi:hypothetical protein
MKIRGFMAILLLTTVIVFFLYTMKTNETAQIEQSIGAFDRAKHRLTETNMSSLNKAVELFTATEGRVPKNLKEVFGQGPLTTGKHDGWGRDIKYEIIDEISFRLTSAGSDGAFGTEDDIVKEY